MGQGLGVRVGLGVQRVDWGLVLGFRVEAEDYRPARYANRAVRVRVRVSVWVGVNVRARAIDQPGMPIEPLCARQSRHAPPTRSCSCAGERQR